jgi:hypothetical protein
MMSTSLSPMKTPSTRDSAAEQPCLKKFMSRIKDRPSENADRAARCSELNRRQFSTMLASVAGLPLISGPDLIYGESLFSTRAGSYPLYDKAASHVLPKDGFQSRIALKDSILKLVDYGVIDRGKFFALYGKTGRHLAEFAHVLSEPSDRPIRLTAANAGHYVDLLWPVGLAMHMAANAKSPLYGSPVKYASTAGWTLGRKRSGMGYFDKFPIVRLTQEQERQVVRIAKTTYRPCCDNSTFFQDCNHGSALLGLLQLGASQGLSTHELYREALAFNAFWFAENYVQTALFFKVVRKIEWADVDPKLVLGYDYSALSSWQRNIADRVAKIRGLIPPAPNGGAGCGV